MTSAKITFTETISPNKRALRHRRHVRRRRITLFGIAVFTFIGLSLYDPDVIERPVQTLEWGFGHSLFIGLLVIACLVAVVGSFAYIVWTLSEGRKAIVLYLRRFGFTTAHETLSRVMESGLSRQYRVVTLDDASFRPREVPIFEKRLSRYGPWIALVAVWVIWTFGLIEHYLAFIPVLLYLYVITWAFTGLFACLQVHRFRVRRRSRFIIQNSHDIRRCLVRLAASASYIRGPALMGPQVTVIKVASELWQEAVAQLSRCASAIVIDVSVLTENLIWEVDFISRTAPDKHVLVGQPEMIRQWGATAPLSVATEAETLLRDKTVLTYTPAMARQQRSFRLLLMTALDNVAVKPQLDVRATFWERTKALAGVTAVYGLLFIFITAIFGAVFIWLVNVVLDS